MILHQAQLPDSEDRGLNHLSHSQQKKPSALYFEYFRLLRAEAARLGHEEHDLEHAGEVYCEANQHFEDLGDSEGE